MTWDFKNAIEGGGDWLNDLYRDVQTVVTGHGRLGARTWHHHEVLGVMESVLTKYHSGPGRNHSGGPVLWTVLNDKEYDPKKGD